MEITCQNDWYFHIEIALPLSHFLGYELLHMKTIREQYFFSSNIAKDCAMPQASRNKLCNRFKDKILFV